MISLAGCTCSAKRFEFKLHIGLVLPMDTMHHSENLAALYCVCIIGNSLSYTTRSYIQLYICHSSLVIPQYPLYITCSFYMLNHHASSLNPWKLACHFNHHNVLESCPHKCNPLSAPPWQAGCVPSYLEVGSESKRQHTILTRAIDPQSSP